MVDPARALLIFGLVAVLSLLVFWPGGGLVARGLLLKGMNERVRMEDALKHLYHAAASVLPATIDSLAGALEVRRGLAVRLVERLTARELARAEADRLVLTEAGVERQIQQASQALRLHLRYTCHGIRIEHAIADDT